MKKRNSSIELLKIIAIFLITISHSMPLYGEKISYYCFQSGLASNDVNYFLINYFRTFGEIGNIIFIICSSWFLLNSSNTKKQKIYSIIIDCFLVSIFYISIAMIFNINISSGEMLKVLFTITGGYSWFITCYILLYLVHPFLNQIINNINKKNYFRILLVLLLLYGLAQMTGKNLYYYSELIGFIVIYFFTGYYKKFITMEKINKIKKIGLLSIVLNYIIMLTINLLGLRIGYFSDKLLIFNTLTNPLYLFFSIYLFYVFNNKNFYNMLINKVSSLSLLYYLIHENYIFRHFIRPLFYKTMFLKYNIWFSILSEIISLFIVGMIVSFLFDQIRKLIQPLVFKITNLIEQKYCSYEKKIINYEK